ncbi:MAG TPA: class I SAM-dependent methyltransferase [Chitinophagales bacterium]|nr:class I SAM-dependent methyltransferase [Chitinophagales bacterium]
MDTLENCPICGTKEYNIFLNCVDYTVSRETFTIVECSFCRFRFTNPRPEVSKLGEYYKSENYISHSNTSKGLINSVYQLVRKYTVLKKLQLISKFYKTGNLLDIGCGTGEFLNICKAAKWNVLGIEPDKETRDKTAVKYNLNVQAEEYLTAIPDSSFEIITMWHVLEHVPFLNKRIEELKRLVKPDGVIIIAVPNCSSLDAKIYKEYWAAYDLPRHLYHFTPDDIQRIFKKHGLRLINVLPMIFDSFYVSMLSEKNRTGNTNLLRSMWNGLRSNLKALKTGKHYSSQIYIVRK